MSVGEVIRLTEEIGKVLAGHEPASQGAALADCLAMWLAGHHVPGDVRATQSMRAELLETHCFEVRNLVSVNAQIIGTTSEPPVGAGMRGALERAIDFLWPHYTDSTMPKMDYAAQSPQCQRLARVLTEYDDQRAAHTVPVRE